MQKAFKLEKVLDFRNRILDKEKAKLSELVINERKISEKVTEVMAEIELKRQEQEQESISGHFEFAVLYEKYIALREKEHAKLKIEQANALKLIEAQRAVLNKSLADVKIMEKLKEKHMIEYAHYMQKLEEKQNDETNTTRQKPDDD